MTDEFINLSDDELGLNETFEPTVMDKGEEAELRIVSFTSGQDKNGDNYIMPFFEVVEDPHCKEFGDYMKIPNADKMSSKELNKARLRIAAWKEAFDIPNDTLDIKNDVIGKTGYAILGVGTDQEDQPINKVNKYTNG